ncbi:hypothetical protein [Tabrizicola aquatica]|uniref:hypothetical protein n=1 Tax=Tabrizicola aquatica TaxID=909926 RepID=UPI000CD1C6A1|nr:hypothetical protein [Tabrizicola aquatica]
MRDHDELPLLTTIRSDDLLDDTTAPTWHRVEPVETVVCSRTFAQDDPEALRSRGPVAVASALLLLAKWGRHAPWQSVREAAALLERYLTGDLRGEDLDAALGLRRRDGGPDLALQARRAERDQLLLKLARTAFADLGPWAAAAAIRKAITDYEVRRWGRERHRPAAPADQIAATAWRVLRLKLPQGAVPRQDDLARMIREDREGR